MYKSPPPNKTYWPGPESHEPYVDKDKLPKIITKLELKNTEKNPNTSGAESHSDKYFTCGCGVTREK